MRIIRRNAKLCLFLALIGLGSVNLLGADSLVVRTDLESTRLAEPGHPTEFETMDWFVKTLPYPVVIAGSDEDKEMNAISDQARALFQARDFAKLDTLFKKLRDSKEQFADGSWKFRFAYSGICPSEDASETEWENHLARLQEWTNAQPKSVTARVAMADAFVSYAWKARGNGPASEVSRVGWMFFSERLTEASRVLIGAREMNERCPYMWSVMFRAELGFSTCRKIFDANFKRAVAAWPDYTAFYQGRAWYFLPRWNGSQGEWESDLEKSADELGGEEGDILYAREVWAMHQSRIFSNIFSDCNISWPRVNKGLAAIEKRFHASLQTLSEHAYLAALAEDAVTTHKYLSLIQGKVDLSIWRTRDTFLHCANWSSMRDDQARADAITQQHQGSELSQLR
jgi:hypothetical protein